MHPQPGSIIRLASDVSWLGMANASADLYVQPHYPQLLMARAEYIEEHNLEKGFMTVFLGAPGGILLDALGPVFLCLGIV